MSDWIDKFGEKIDRILFENEVAMLIRLPKNSMEPKISSHFDELQSGGKNVMEFYILLQALSRTVKDLIAAQKIDEDKVETMVDAMLEMVKADIIGGED